MGRIFEKRKHKMFARYLKMARMFTRIGKEISIAVKQGGPNPDGNPRLRQAIQNAKGVNMPKERVDNAIKRAVSKEQRDFEELVYEGFAPYGVAVLIEAATDNPTRTVANLRVYFNRANGALGTQGSVAFMFERKGLFKFEKGNHNVEDLELDLIDYGANEVLEDDSFIYIYTGFEDFGKMAKALEDKGIEVISAELLREALNTVSLTDEQEQEVQAMLDKIEDDEDVQNVFHNMA
ncbi:MAG: YebC/PmpR family DNA-binding transcriptional regulator [Bacteroidia bacterium]|nr:YebC/PmpR family DNA-binding transcriptional regulator [Bacteroidia bacterium]